MTKLNAQFVRSILKYDPDSGRFFWKERSDVGNYWNALFAGKETGRPKKSGYAFVTIHDRGYLAHRIAWLYMTGKWPEEIDHKDGNPSNNRWDNLREATRQQNQRNRRRHSSNSSGLKGVYKNRIGTTWSAQVYLYGRKIHVGNFPTAESAHSAYCVAAKELYGEFARTA